MEKHKNMKKISVKFQNRVRKRGIENTMFQSKILKLAEEHPDKNRITIRGNHFYDKFTGEMIDQKILKGQRLVNTIYKTAKKEEPKTVVSNNSFEQEYQNFINELKKKSVEKKEEEKVEQKIEEPVVEVKEIEKEDAQNKTESVEKTRRRKTC